MKAGQTDPQLRRQGGVGKERRPPGLAAVPNRLQGQGVGQQAPGLRLAQTGEPRPGITPPDGQEGRAGQQQISQGPLMPEENAAHRLRRRQRS